MGKKVKQSVIIDNQSYGTGSIGISDSTFKELPNTMKHGNKLTTLTHLRNCIHSGQFHGEFTVGNKLGYLFTYQGENVLVDKDVRTILAAYRDKVEQPIHINKPKVDKRQIEPLESVIDTPKLNLDTIDLTGHFLEQIRDRFYITDKNLIRKFIKDFIANGEYIGIRKDKELEREAHLYSKRGIALYISLDLDAVITIYEVEKVNNIPKEAIKSFVRKKINKLQKDEATLNNSYNRIKEYEIDKEVAECYISFERARSKARKLACQARINALLQHKEEMKNQRYNVSKMLRDYQKSLVAFT